LTVAAQGAQTQQHITAVRSILKDQLILHGLRYWLIWEKNKKNSHIKYEI
jgi:hypothetical protein